MIKEEHQCRRSLGSSTVLPTTPSQHRIVKAMNKIYSLTSVAPSSAAHFSTWELWPIGGGQGSEPESKLWVRFGLGPTRWWRHTHSWQVLTFCTCRKKGGNNTHFVGLLWELSELIRGKNLCLQAFYIVTTQKKSPGSDCPPEKLLVGLSLPAPRVATLSISLLLLGIHTCQPPALCYTQMEAAQWATRRWILEINSPWTNIYGVGLRQLISMYM